MTKIRENVELELYNGDRIAVVRLNRPEVHNAIDGAVIERLEEIVDHLEAIDPYAVVLTGAGERTFCSGGDLTYFTDLSPEDALVMSRHMQEILRRLEDGPRPVIAALDGHVHGGGSEISVACHLRIARAGITFSFRPAALGVITGWGGGRRLWRLLGRSTAMRLLMLAEKIDAQEALRLGLVDQVVEGSALEKALEWADRMTHNSRGSIRGFLAFDRAWRATPQETTAQQRLVAEETSLFGELWSGEDFQQTLADWRER